MRWRPPSDDSVAVCPDRRVARPGSRRSSQLISPWRTHLGDHAGHCIHHHRQQATDYLFAERPGRRPLARTEIKIGYAQVSTGGQKLQRQIDVLTAARCRVPGAGCRKIFADKKSGKNALRPEVKRRPSFLAPVSFAGQHDALASEGGGQAQLREAPASDGSAGSWSPCLRASAFLPRPASPMGLGGCASGPTTQRPRGPEDWLDQRRTSARTARSWRLHETCAFSLPDP
ncbi:recombinase family protein [Streptomyces acidicola]|uniref:recombinase family protein n=1 Tax=Streptomyces acidicola TaxID=2596892 RepID=UPI0038015DCC